MEVISANNMRAVQYTSGEPENLYIGSVPKPKLNDEEVLIKVFTSAINRADTLQRRGLYPPPPGASDILGLEAAGVIEKLSPSCLGNWKEGDRVMVLLSGGGNAEYVAVHEKHLIAIPENMSFTDAAAIPEAWLTAFQLLVVIGKLTPNDIVLIHAGASGIGTAAIQLVKVFGARSLVTAGSAHKIHLAKNLGADEGFNYKEGNWADKVLQYTQGRGVNLILDCIGASYWLQNTDVIALDGHWVLYGLLGGSEISGDLLARILRKRIRLEGSILRGRSKEYKINLIKEFTEKVLPYFESGVLKPIIHQILPFAKIGEAHEIMEKNANVGKIVILIQPKNKVNFLSDEL